MPQEAPSWMDSLESIEREGKRLSERIDFCLSKSPDHLISMALDGTTVQDYLGRLFFRVSEPCKPGDILSRPFQVIDKSRNMSTHAWDLHFKVLAPVSFKDVKVLAKHSLHHPRVEPRPGNWYEVHAD